MNQRRSLQQMISVIWVAVFLLGCAVPWPVPQSVSTLPPPPPTPGQPVQPTGQASTCSRGEPSILGVLRSTDHGATWTSLGNACMPDSEIGAVDPTGLVIDGQIVLYFVDIVHLGQPVPQVLYRATSVDGVNFDTPQPAYTQTRTMIDPFVLRIPDGSFRLYVFSDQEGIISAVSSDGLAFTREDGVRSTVGTVPGALLLPDNRVRLFVCTGMIISYISSDGLNFTEESGVRIPAGPNTVVHNPQPIQLNDGSYLMLFSINDKKYNEQGDPWTFTEMHLATSTEGYNWTANPTNIGYGGTSCAVEMPDGTLYVYYVNGNP